jgi:hypothetical protein
MMLGHFCGGEKICELRSMGSKHEGSSLLFLLFSCCLVHYIKYKSIYLPRCNMFLPAESLRVILTEEDAKRCSRFSVWGVEDNRFFKDGNVQRYYEFFQIQRTSRSFMLLVLFGLLLIFSFGLLASFTTYGDVWVMRVVLIIRVLLCIIGCYIYFKIFHARVHPHESSREEFQRYVAQVTALSNFIVITLAAVMWRMFGKHR